VNGDADRFAAAVCSVPRCSWNDNFSLAGDTLKIDGVIERIDAIHDSSSAEPQCRSYRQVEA
jgi:hypothetical protein